MLNRSTLALAAMLLAGAVSTASAGEAFDVDLYHGNPNAQSYWNETGPATRGPLAYAPVAPSARHARAQAINPNAVYENGKYIGQDPDPNVRLMLEQDFSFQ